MCCSAVLKPRKWVDMLDVILGIAISHVKEPADARGVRRLLTIDQNPNFLTC